MPEDQIPTHTTSNKQSPVSPDLFKPFIPSPHQKNVSLTAGHHQSQTKYNFARDLKRTQTITKTHVEKQRAS